MVRRSIGGRVFIGAAVSAALLTAAGCASSASHSSASPSGGTSTSLLTSESSSPSSGSSSAVNQNSAQAQAALSTYRAMWADVVMIQSTMNDQDTSLTDHLTGDALTYFHQAIHLNHLDGYVAKGEPQLLHPVVTQIVGSGSSAQTLVTDCVNDAAYNLYTSDGTLVKDNDPGGRRQTQALVVESGSVLKVSQFAYSRAGTC